MKTSFQNRQNKTGSFSSLLFKSITLLFFVIYINVAYAQDSDKEEYMIATIGGDFYNIEIYIDYNPDNIQRKPKVEKDSTGNPILFATKSAAINYIAKQGWILLYPISDNKNPINTGDTFIFKRRVLRLITPKGNKL